MKQPKNRLYINGSKIFDFFNVLFILIFTLLILVPILNIVASSFASNTALAHGNFIFFPSEFSLDNYKAVLNDDTIMRAFLISVSKTVIGVVTHVSFCAMVAYGLSKPNLKFRKLYTAMGVFTMYFSGGMIPTYMIYHDLGLVGNRWALIVNGLISTYNMIILISSFRELPDALEESARIDGAGDWTILFRIVVPLSLPSIMVIALYYAVSRWNSWFPASLYLTNVRDWPIQMFLRRMLIEEQMEEMMAGSGAGTMEADSISQTLKYAMIMVSTVPILAVYPFIQRYFVKGIMIGAVKG